MGYKYNWSLSPDGSTIATAVWRSNQIQFLSTTNGSTKSVVVKGQGGILTLDWGADGRSLWASSSTATGAEMLVNIGLRGEARPMLEDPDKDVGWAIPSPDGHRVAVWEATGSANAWSSHNSALGHVPKEVLCADIICITRTYENKSEWSWK